MLPRNQVDLTPFLREWGACTRNVPPQISFSGIGSVVGGLICGCRRRCSFGGLLVLWFRLWGGEGRRSLCLYTLPCGTTRGGDGGACEGARLGGIRILERLGSVSVPRMLLPGLRVSRVTRPPRPTRPPTTQPRITLPIIHTAKKMAHSTQPEKLYCWLSRCSQN